MGQGKIYKHRNLQNNKVYIGQTWREPERRWRKGQKSLSAHKNTKALYNALKVYGWDGFDTTIIHTCSNQTELDSWEEFFITIFNSQNPDYGYNIKTFCQGREVQAESTKELIRLKATGRTRESAWNTQKHVIIEGKEFRKCGRCKELKTLDQYQTVHRKKGPKPDTYCKYCKNKYKRDNHGYVRKDADQVSLTRKAQAVENSKRFGTPEMREFYRKLHSKPIIRLTINGMILAEYACAKDANHEGFKSPGISTACKTGLPYKGFLWKFKQ